MKKMIPFLILALIFCMIPPGGSSAKTAAIQLGSDVLFDPFHQLIEGKKVGLLTNQTGVNSKGASTIDLLRRDRTSTLAALIAPEYGLNGKASASQAMVPWLHPVYGIPVYSLNATKREPAPDLFKQMDVLLVDLQDTGARTSPYIANLYDCLSAARQQGKPVIILDRPNPLGGQIVDGPVLEADYRSYIGVDTLPLAHGMTIGELALFFNRGIGADLTVVPMKGYTRGMLYQETGLAWIPNAPNLRTLPAVFGYMATGIADGTSLLLDEDYSWVGGGLEQEKHPQDLEASYAKQLAAFIELRQPYLIYGEEPYQPLLPVRSKPAAAPQPEVQPPTPAAPTTADAPGTAALPEPGAEGTKGSAGSEQPGTNPAQPGANPPAGQPVIKPPAVKPAPPVADKVAYLTFDDGPSVVTPVVLDALKKFGVKATFFVVGRNVAGHEAILRRTLAEGHAIGGHSYSHDYRIVYKSKEAFFTDLEKGNQLIEKATGVKPALFRYPGGSTNTVSHKYQDPKQYDLAHPVMHAINAEAAKRKYIFIDWNITNGDARSSEYTAQGAIANIKQQVKNQKEIVILMHDSSTKSPTAQALPEIITFLKSKGYRFDVIKPDHPTVSTVK